MISSLGLRTWEKLILILSAMLMVSGGVLVGTGFTVRRLIESLGNVNSANEVGTVELQSGNLKRKAFDSMFFEIAGSGRAVFNRDTLITDQKSKATIRLKDGGEIQLGPNTMIQLSFESNFSWDGLKKRTAVQVITGEAISKLAPTDKRDAIVLKSSDGQISDTKIVAPPPPQVVPEATDAKLLPKDLPKSFVPVPETIIQPAPPAPAAVVQAESPASNAESNSKVSEVPQPEVTLPTSRPVALPSIRPVFKEPGEPPKIEDSKVQVKDLPLTPEKKVNIEWRTDSANSPVQVVIKKQSADGKKVEVFTKVVQSQGNQGQLDFVLEEPGNYTWEVVPAVENKKQVVVTTQKGQLTVDKEFKGIDEVIHKIGSDTNADEETESDVAANPSPLPGQSGVPGAKPTQSGIRVAQDVKADIALKWRPVPKAKEYRIAFYASPGDKKPIYETSVDESKLKVEISKVFDKQYHPKIYYQVTSELENGFKARSDMNQVDFEQFAPISVLPENDAIVPRTQLARDEGKLIFTWERVKLAKTYTFELYTQEEGGKPLVQVKTGENFHVVEGLKVGSYWWKVTSIIADRDGPGSRKSKITVSAD